ncbi:MAG TPA: hypothetical protein VE264_02600 [Nitrososphaera sp.]|jgi:hypothetical protein|nr:hypothetical protein [Nitrososphaera sp.]
MHEKIPTNLKMQTEIVEKVDAAMYISDELAAVMLPDIRGK